MDERIAELEKGGLGEDFAQCPDGFVEAVVEEIERKYGGVERYMTEKLCINSNMQLHIRNQILAA